MTTKDDSSSGCGVWSLDVVGSKGDAREGDAKKDTQSPASGMDGLRMPLNPDYWGYSYCALSLIRIIKGIPTFVVS